MSGMKKVVLSLNLYIYKNTHTGSQTSPQHRKL